MLQETLRELFDFSVVSGRRLAILSILLLFAALYVAMQSALEYVEDDVLGKKTAVRLGKRAGAAMFEPIFDGIMFVVSNALNVIGVGLSASAQSVIDLARQFVQRTRVLEGVLVNRFRNIVDEGEKVIDIAKRGLTTAVKDAAKLEKEANRETKKAFAIVGKHVKKAFDKTMPNLGSEGMRIVERSIKNSAADTKRALFGKNAAAKEMSDAAARVVKQLGRTEAAKFANTGVSKLASRAPSMSALSSTANSKITKIDQDMDALRKNIEKVFNKNSKSAIKFLSGGAKKAEKFIDNTSGTVTQNIDNVASQLGIGSNTFRGIGNNIGKLFGRKKHKGCSNNPCGVRCQFVDSYKDYWTRNACLVLIIQKHKCACTFPQDWRIAPRRNRSAVIETHNGCESDFRILTQVCHVIDRVNIKSGRDWEIPMNTGYFKTQNVMKEISQPKWDGLWAKLLPVNVATKERRMGQAFNQYVKDGDGMHHLMFDMFMHRYITSPKFRQGFNKMPDTEIDTFAREWRIESMDLVMSALSKNPVFKNEWYCKWYKGYQKRVHDARVDVERAQNNNADAFDNVTATSTGVDGTGKDILRVAVNKFRSEQKAIDDFLYGMHDTLISRVYNNTTYGHFRNPRDGEGLMWLRRTLLPIGASDYYR